MLRSAFDQFSRHVGNVDLLQGETAEERAALLDGVLECLDAAEDELSSHSRRSSSQRPVRQVLPRRPGPRA